MCSLKTHLLIQRAGDLRQKDVEQALIYEEKIALLLKLLSATGVEVDIEHPSYRQLVAQYLDSDTMRKVVLSTIEVGRQERAAFTLWHVADRC